MHVITGCNPSHDPYDQSWDVYMTHIRLLHKSPRNKLDTHNLSFVKALKHVFTFLEKDTERSKSSL